MKMHFTNDAFPNYYATLPLCGRTSKLSFVHNWLSAESSSIGNIIYCVGI